MSNGLLMIQSWAGLLKYPVEIVGETPKKYRIKWILEESFVPPKSGTVRFKGDIFLVPKHAVKVKDIGGGNVRDANDK